jgi:hypothetical protein
MNFTGNSAGAIMSKHKNGILVIESCKFEGIIVTSGNAVLLADHGENTKRVGKGQKSCYIHLIDNTFTGIESPNSIVIAN